MNPLQEKKIKEFREKFKDMSHVGCSGGAPCATIKSDVEEWLTTTLEEVYKAGKDEGDMLSFGRKEQLREEGFKEGEKNGLSRSVEAVKKLNTIGDGVDAWFKEEAIKSIESLN